METTTITREASATGNRVTVASLEMTRAQADRSLRALGLSITRCSQAIEIVRRKRWPASVKAMTQADHEITREALQALHNAITQAFGMEARK